MIFATFGMACRGCGYRRAFYRLGDYYVLQKSKPRARGLSIARRGICSPSSFGPGELLENESAVSTTTTWIGRFKTGENIWKLRRLKLCCHILGFTSRLFSTQPRWNPTSILLVALRPEYDNLDQLIWTTASNHPYHALCRYETLA